MKKIYDLEGRNKAIVLFKFFAALLITYSHMGLMFPKFGGLVTGGAIGDGLFFFCSGFTLFLGRDGGFLNWYKRRVSRIYPSIIMWALLSAVAFGWTWYVTDLITTPRYWFIPCIMVYYAIFYVIRRYLMKYMKAVFVGSLLIITALSFFVLDMERSVMYAQVSFMRIYYFMFMLLGAITALDLRKPDNEMIFGGLRRMCIGGGKSNEELRIKNEELSASPIKKQGSAAEGKANYRIKKQRLSDEGKANEELKGSELKAMRSFLLFFGSIVLYYACMAAYKLGPVYCHFQMVSLIPLLLSIYFFFMFCSCEKMTKVFDRALCGNVVYFISSLTLEIYLVQYALFTDRMNFMFPLNIPIMYLMIFSVAYVLKVLSQGFSQIFGKEDVAVKKLFGV